MAAPAASSAVGGSSAWLRLVEHSDTALAIGAVGVLAVLVIPLPPPLLDILLTVNISLSLIVLMVVLNCGQPLDFSTFPSLLLFTTLFRLSLNVASTRLILLKAYAGNVILSFGQFVVGGSIVVGLVVFLILVVVQFVVITKGAGRIAEVAARFTLDAMPGKQMAIDADLNSQTITEKEARERREGIAREAEFYGAMDGASKFVRGDAIAGIVITLVNLFGGMVIGLMNHMPLGDAVAKYAILTVGDGLVSQIPSLIVATSAGVLITKASSKTNLSRDVTAQMAAHPRPVGVAAALLFLFALVPGLPTMPFAVMGVVFGLLWYAMRRHAAARAEAPEPEEAGPAPGAGEPIEHPPLIDRLSVEFGYGLIALFEPSDQGGLPAQIVRLRRNVASTLGFIIPPIRITDNVQLDPDTYVIRIRGQEVGRMRLRLDKLLAVDFGAGTDPVPGERTTEPAYGLPALWVDLEQQDLAEMAGYTVITPATALVTHLSEVIKRHADEILGREDVQELLKHLREKQAPTVVNELVPNLMTVGGVQAVLENLLREGVPILDLAAILEALSDKAAQVKDPDVLTELVRQRLARTLCSQYLGSDGRLHAIYLDGEVEQRLLQSVGHADAGAAVPLEPAYTRTLLERTGAAVVEARGRGLDPVLLTSPLLRRHLWTIVAPTLPGVPVLSYNEILRSVDVEVAATVGMRDDS